MLYLFFYTVVLFNCEIKYFPRLGNHREKFKQSSITDAIASTIGSKPESF
jgi:hypothetical protein